MKYEIAEFQRLIGANTDNAEHIHVKIDSRLKYGLLAHPAGDRDEAFCAKLDGEAQLYVSVNLCRPVYNKPKISDVAYWTCEYIDLDCERPDHSIPATDEELAALKPEINDINNWLGMNGFMTGYFDFTGNGYRWLLPVPPLSLHNLNVEAVMLLNEQKKEFLRIMKRETGANIDTSVGELSRITGIPGTLNVKARDSTDRRREPFRGCHRLEDKALQDYVMNLEISPNESMPDPANYPGTSNQTLDIIMSIDKATQTLINRAPSLLRGHRSEYDYSIALKMKFWKISIPDAVEILLTNGTSKARPRGSATERENTETYVKRTVLNAYGGA